MRRAIVLETSPHGKKKWKMRCSIPPWRLLPRFFEVRQSAVVNTKLPKKTSSYIKLLVNLLKLLLSCVVIEDTHCALHADSIGETPNAAETL